MSVDDESKSEILVVGPVITAPSEYATLYPGFIVNAVIPTGFASAWRLEFHLDNGGTIKYSGGWIGTVFNMKIPDNAIPPGVGFYFSMDYKAGLVWSAWTNRWGMRMAAGQRPTFTTPPGNLVKEKRPTFSGRGERGAIIKLYQSGSTKVEYGRGTVGNDRNWRFQVTQDLPQGDTFSMAAYQTLSGQTQYSDSVPFTVLYRPVIGNVTVTDLKPTINGSGGLPNAKVEVFFVGVGGEVQATAQVRADGSWTAIAPRSWLTGKYSITAQQIAPNSRRRSDLAVEKTVTIPPPAPVITQPSSPLERGNAIHGTGFYSGATLVVRRNGAVVGGRVTTSGSIWSFIADQMWPGDWTITAEQTLGGQNSGRSTPRSFKVRPPKLKITDPAPGSPVPSSQRISGNNSLHYETTITMQNGAGQLVPGTVTKPVIYEWSFTPATALTPGSHTFKAVQTVSGEASLPSDALTVTVKPPQLIITQPSAPMERGQAITGTGYYPGAALVVRRGSSVVAGTLTPNGSNWSFIADQMWPGDWTITAEQSINGQTSVRSEPRSFKVRPPKLNITDPAPNSSVPSSQRISGNNSLHYETTITMQNGAGASVPGTVTKPQTYLWSFAPATALTPGSHTFKAVQTVSGEASLPSDALTVTVKPPQLIITQPSAPMERGQAITGTGYYPGATLVVRRGNSAVTGTLTSNGGNWSFIADQMWPGDWTITAEQSINGQTSVRSEPRSFKVRPPKLKITDPGPGSTVPSSQRISGNNSMHYETTITMQNGAGASVPGTVTKPQTYLWSFAPATALTPGSHTFKAVQTVSGEASLPSDALTVTVKPPPLIITPPSKPITARTPLTVTQVHASATSLRMLRSDETGEVAGNFTGSGATRTFTPRDNWSFGTNSVKVTQTVNTVESDPSAPCTFTLIPTQLAILPPSEPVVQRSPLTVTQVDLKATQLKMSRAGTTDEVTGNFNGTGTTREFIPDTDWEWGSNSVTVVQTVEGVVSNPSAPCTFTFNLPRPVMTGPTEPTDGRPTFEGTGHDGATVEVVRHTFPHTVLAKATVANGRWQAPLLAEGPDFVAGSHIMSGSQIVGEVRSGWMAAFSIKIKPPQPAILPPIGVIAARTPLTVINVYTTKTPTLKMLQTGTTKVVDGDFVGSGATRTFIPRDNWSIGANSVTVTQAVGTEGTEDTVESDPSAPCTFTHILPPPVITGPSEPTSSRPTFGGQGYEGATVNVHREGFPDPVLATATVLSGEWQAPLNTEISDLPAGRYYVNARQSFEGEWSVGIDTPFEIQIKPHQPVITPPREPLTPFGALTITQVHAEVSELKMFTDWGMEVGGTFSPVGTDWVFEPAMPWIVGDNAVKVVQVVDTVASDPSAVCFFKGRPPKPDITPPNGPLDPQGTLEITQVYVPPAD
ncbi:hypothetical protein [Pseudomonas sp. BIC9C]|uniref:hypothetical protein n=1 Tax=Pseudomonas sp. BIC9C TaxID=3078458 RepID=UPI002AD38519|nr:hypothetical protein [Pseudomonas sp. BIC9C]